MLKNKVVVVGVTGSIAAYKSAQLVSDLVKEGCEVHVIMTENAVNFINPITFETLTGRKCLVDTFDRNFEYSVTHVSLSQKADVFMIAPASANIIGKIANGIADDMLSTMVMAAKCPVLIAPAMNKYMFMNTIVQENIEKLKRHDYRIISPAVGRLSCNDTGVGKLPDVDVLIEHIKHEIAHEKDYKGLKVLITAGPTQESLDPVRYITNHSSGKMGYSLARVAAMRGAEVTLVSGPSALKTPAGVRRIDVISAEDMFNAMNEVAEKADTRIVYNRLCTGAQCILPAFQYDLLCALVLYADPHALNGYCHFPGSRGGRFPPRTYQDNNHNLPFHSAYRSYPGKEVGRKDLRRKAWT